MILKLIPIKSCMLGLWHKLICGLRFFFIVLFWYLFPWEYIHMICHDFQEYWCKKLHPKNVCEKVYRQPPLRESLKKWKLRKQDFGITKQKAALIRAADSIGKKIQYDCPGFLPNRRQVNLFMLYIMACYLHLFISFLSHQILFSLGPPLSYFVKSN